MASFVKIRTPFYFIYSTTGTIANIANIDVALQQQENQACDDDFVIIPNGVGTAAEALTVNIIGAIRVCGRYFRTTIGTGNGLVCCKF